MAAHPMLEVVPTLLRLNLGCHTAHVKGYLNIDLCEPADVIVDLSKPWPWAEIIAEGIDK